MIMKMVLMVFGSGLTDTWKLEENEIHDIAKSLLDLYNERHVTAYCDGRVYASWSKGE